MEKFIPYWYDNQTTVEDTPIIAESKEEAEKLAYKRYGGNPPCKMLYLLHVSGFVDPSEGV